MRMRAAAIPPIVLAAAVMAPGACGQAGSSDTSKFSEPAKSAAQAVYDLRDAVVKRDENKVCASFFTVAVQQQLAAQARADHRGSTCADELKNAIQDVDSTDLTVQTVTVAPGGRTATVTYKTKLANGPDPVDTLQLANQHGWRVSRLP